MLTFEICVLLVVDMISCFVSLYSFSSSSPRLNDQLVWGASTSFHYVLSWTCQWQCFARCFELLRHREPLTDKLRNCACSPGILQPRTQFASNQGKKKFGIWITQLWYYVSLVPSLLLVSLSTQGWNVKPRGLKDSPYGYLGTRNGCRIGDANFPVRR